MIEESRASPENTAPPENRGSPENTASPGSTTAHEGAIAKLAAIATQSGLSRIHILAWRDLSDPEAGGSEVHIARIASLWAEAGIEVTMRTSHAPGHTQATIRDGYRVFRRAGRYMVFPRAAASEMLNLHGRREGLVEIWNGMPFFSPVWARGPRIVFCHHVHAEMWRMVLSPGFARLGDTIERKIAPPFYRRSRIVTLSNSSKSELVNDLAFRPERITVVPPGIDPMFTPGGPKASHPLVVAVGRLVPVKRLDLLIDQLLAVRELHPTLEAVLIGEGYERDGLEEKIRVARATSWIKLPGRLTDDALVDLYRRAWVLVSASAREGWGMTITEAAACGTPAVVTRIAGHNDAVVDGETGWLAEPGGEFVTKLDSVLSDEQLRERLATGALTNAIQFTWEATAIGTLEALAEQARHKK